MLFIPLVVQALDGQLDPVLAGALYCLGEGPAPAGFTRDAPDKPTWRTSGPDTVMLAETDRGCMVLRFRVKTRAREAAMDAWLVAHPVFRLDRDDASGGQRVRDYSRTVGEMRQHLRLIEPANLDGPRFADPPSGVSVWTEAAPK